MFAHIRRHQKWLWLFISAAVIISFVWYFNPNQQMGAGDVLADDGVVGTMYGDPISRSDYSAAYREAMIQYLFSYGEWPSQSQMARQLGLSIEREARNRLLLLRKLEDYKIEVSDKATADWIRSAFEDRETGTFRKEVYDNLLTQLPAQGLRQSDFENYARHQVGIQHLAALAGAPGKMITPQEAAYQYRQEKQKRDAKVVLLNTSNYLAAVEMTPEALGQFYTNRSSAYREPEKVVLSYVEFPITNYLAAADQKMAAETNLNQRIEMLYAQRGANFYTDENNQVMTPEAAKEQIRNEVRRELAQLEARRAAGNLGLKLEEAVTQNPPQPGNPNPAENLEKVAAAAGLEVKTTRPFSQFEGPGFKVPAQFGRLAFALSPEEPVVLEPIVGEDAAYLISFKERIPSRVQPLDEIRARVTTDFTRSESYRLARAAGTNLVSHIRQAMENGVTFESAASEAGFQPTDLEPFAQDARLIPGLPPQADAATVARTAFETAPGTVSDFVTTRDGGIIVYVEDIIPVNEEELQRELPAYLAQLRRTSATQAFDDWFRTEMQKAQLRLADDESDSEQRSSL